MLSDAKCKFTPTTILLGPPPHPWMRGISSQLLQCLQSYWGFSELGRRVSPHARPTTCSLCSWPAPDVGYFLLAAHCSSTSGPPLTTAFLKWRGGQVPLRPDLGTVPKFYMVNFFLYLSQQQLELLIAWLWAGMQAEGLLNSVSKLTHSGDPKSLCSTSQNRNSLSTGNQWNLAGLSNMGLKPILWWFYRF